MTAFVDSHRSVGSVGDAYDNALAESFVDSFKTELITDRVWQTRSQLELAVVEYVGWFNNGRPHEALADIPPIEYEQHHADRSAVAASLRAPYGLAPRDGDAEHEGATTLTIESTRPN